MAGGTAMSEEAAIIARRWFEEVWNARRGESIEELMERDAVGHMEGGDVHGPDEFRDARAVFLEGLPDMQITIEDILSQGERAAVRWKVCGTHMGSLFGIPPSHRRVEVRGTSWLR